MNIFYPDGLGLCGECGALPNRACHDSRGQWLNYPHADRYPVGFRRTLGPYSKLPWDRRPMWARIIRGGKR